MYLIEVIPAINIPREHPQILSYFSNEPLERGALILIPLRNRPVPAIVLSQTDISSQKTQLKKASFSIKKINKIIYPEPILSEKEFKFLKWFADYYFLPLGLALKTILPEKLLKAKKPIPPYSVIAIHQLEEKQSIHIKSSLYFADNRTDFYIQKIKYNLKKNKPACAGRQSLILFPEQINALAFFNKISDTFESNQISFLAGNLTPKKYFDEWQKIASSDAKIIIGARSAVFSKFADLGLIIIDEEQDQSFKSWDMRPYYNARECAIKLGEIFGAETILGSNTPSIESYHKINNKQQTTNYKLLTTNYAIVDMRDEVRKSNEIISEDLATELKKISQNNEQALIFINRRGSATFIFCQECGFSLHCKNCDAPMVFHKIITSEKQLICHHCGYREKSPNICPKCGGNKIKYSGIASQKAEEKIKELFPNLKIKRLDSETVLSASDIQSAIADFNNKKIDIILGTQIILNKNFKGADLIAVLSIDTILNLPEFRSDERIYQIINQLKKYKRDESTPFILQTFKPEQEIFSISLKSDFENLYNREIETRKTLNYPPFSQLIKLTHKNPNPIVAIREAQKITEQLTKLTETKNCKILGPASGFIPKLKGQYIYNIIIKSNLDIKERNKLLSIIPIKDWSIDIDPITLI